MSILVAMTTKPATDRLILFPSGFAACGWSPDARLGGLFFRPAIESGKSLCGIRYTGLFSSFMCAIVQRRNGGQAAFYQRRLFLTIRN
jgi:hypothetical protein